MSEIKVNKISPRAACGTTTLGDSGDTFTIPAGVSITNNGTASGFGATGAASWNTTVKTGDFTATAGEGYFVNTTSGAITVTLPASPSAGAVVAIKDYADTFDTNNLTLARNGSNIGGAAENSIINTEGIAVTLVYVDATKGWLVTDSGLQSEAPGPSFITATGGTVTTVCTNFKVHTFTGPGTFTVNCAGNSAGSNTVDYLVIAGGGAGGAAGGHGATVGSGGGAGGYRESSGAASGCYTRSPVGAGVSALSVAAQSYPITIGAGATSTFPCNASNTGSNSIFSTITSAGGGGGVGTSPACGFNGGSGGGGGAVIPSAGTGGAGNTPPVSPPQGNNGGNGQAPKQGGGGGGATTAGTPGSSSNPVRGKGGSGGTSCITSSPVARGGGGGGANTNSAPNAGPGGGGAGPSSSSGGTGGNGTVNTGGGGGGGPHGAPTDANGGVGGSGIVIIRYRFQ